MATPADLANWFTYHAPFGDQAERYGKIREAAREFAAVVLAATPACADQTACLRMIREAVMAANQTIACNERES